MKKFLLFLLTLYAVAVVPAFADTVSLKPIEDLVNEFVQTILEGVAMAVSGWLMFVFHKYLTPWIGAQLEAKARDSLNTALANGVQIALQKIEDAQKVHSSVDVKGAVSAWAAQYAIDHAPGAVSKFGLDPNQLALKALAYIPPPPTSVDVSATAVVAPPAKVEETNLPDITPQK